MQLTPEIELVLALAGLLLALIGVYTAYRRLPN